jgi:hypothetical protein
MVATCSSSRAGQRRSLLLNLRLGLQRQLRVRHGMLDIAMAEACLQRPGVMTAALPQHVRIGLVVAV